jgi:hypothetical protein
LDLPDPPVPLEQPVRLDLLDLRDRPGPRAPLDLLGPLEREAFRRI